jgi:radical SAM superfamily enzyme YgiQ (UPF0313 family)
VVDVLLVGAEELENLGIRYLAAVLRQHGYRVELAAFSRVDELEEVVRRARALRPRLIGLSVIFQYRAPEFVALADRLRSVLPEVHLTMGGHFPSFAATELLRDCPALDTVVRGEGEFTLLELVNQLCAPDRWGSILGLSFRRDGQPVENPPRPLIADLDALPMPARDTPPQHHLGIGYAPIAGSRGCYRDCSFCSIRSFYGASQGRLQRFRSVSNLVDEMEMLYDRFGVRFFVFNDDEWFPAGAARNARVADLERELECRRLQVIMSIKCRADDVEEELFRRLLHIGVVRAYVGVESGSDRSLHALNKHTTVAQNRRALQVLHRVGMLADFGLIFFDPDSTVEDVRANLYFLREMGATGLAPLSFGRLEVYAGTPILAHLRAAGRLTGSYMAWNYTLADARVEMLWRLMYTAMWRRHYENDGMAKQCSMAYYELMMIRYLHADRYDPAVGETLRDIVARVNNHSLTIFEEMFDFTMRADIGDPGLVNERAIGWATRINLFDVQVAVELEDWRRQVAGRVGA